MKAKKVQVKQQDSESIVMKRLLSMQTEVNKHLEKHNRNLQDELILILDKKSTLPLRLRMFIMTWCEYQLNQQQQENEKSSIEGENTVGVLSDLPDELPSGE